MKNDFGCFTIAASFPGLLCRDVQKKRENSTTGFTLVEILIVIGIIALLAGIVLVAINPSRQFAQARNTQRSAHINSILSAIGQYTVDHQGAIPGEIPDTATEISSGGADICSDLVPIYLAALPVDPTIGDTSIEETGCGNYETGYEVSRDPDTRRVTVSGPLAAMEEALGVDAEELSVTR